MTMHELVVSWAKTHFPKQTVGYVEVNGDIFKVHFFGGYLTYVTILDLYDYSNAIKEA